VRSTEAAQVHAGAALEPIPWRQLAPWLWLVPMLLLVAYLVGMDQGAISRSGLYIHEFMHDGRHLLAVPCH
jgi:hypothetical protein